MDSLWWNERYGHWDLRVNIDSWKDGGRGEGWKICCGTPRPWPLDNQKWLVFLELPQELWTEKNSRPAVEQWFQAKYGRGLNQPAPPPEPIPKPDTVCEPVQHGPAEADVDQALESHRRDLIREFASTIYFMEAVGTDRVKIGWSLDFIRRQRDIQACCPVPLRVIHTERGEKAREQSLHLQFAGDRLHGEWFVLSDAIRDYVSHGLYGGGLS